MESSSKPVLPVYSPSTTAQTAGLFTQLLSKPWKMLIPALQHHPRHISRAMISQSLFDLQAVYIAQSFMFLVHLSLQYIHPSTIVLLSYRERQPPVLEKRSESESARLPPKSRLLLLNAAAEKVLRAHAIISSSFSWTVARARFLQCARSLS
jgi:hypothetical protein